MKKADDCIIRQDGKKNTTDIIKPHNSEETVEFYFSPNTVKEDFEEETSSTYEIEERTLRNEDYDYVDALGVDIEIGNDIAFISRHDGNAIKEGQVYSLAKGTIIVEVDYEQYRLLVDPEDGRSIRKAIIIKRKYIATKTDINLDALGQPLEEFDNVAYRKEIYQEKPNSFAFGTIIKLTGAFAFILDFETKKEIRRRHDLIICLSRG